MRERFDVAVVGGGSAGIAAALGAAELGARTLLLERSDVLGGNASNAFVHTVCGLYRSAAEGDALPALPGFALRFARALRAGGAAGEAERTGKVWVLPTEPTRIPQVAEALCAQAKDLAVWSGAECVSLALGAGAAPHRLAVRSRAGTRAIDADLVLDTSGDAAAGALAGAETETPETLQLPSFIFRLAGVDTRELQGFARLRVTHAVAGAVRAGSLPPGCEAVLVRPAVAPHAAYVTLNLPRPKAYRPLDSRQRHELEAAARDRAERVLAFLRDRPAFARARVDAWPRCIGVREARRLEGRSTVTRDDVLQGRRCESEVALSTWPIELWHDHRRVRFEYPAGPCSVPLGALVSRSHPRLGMAGRCLSATHEALGALRVIGTALATGEALGVAAALAANAGRGLPEIAAADIRAHIRERAERGDRA